MMPFLHKKILNKTIKNAVAITAMLSSSKRWGRVNFETLKSLEEEVFIHHMRGTSIYGGSNDGNQNGG